MREIRAYKLGFSHKMIDQFIKKIHSGSRLWLILSAWFAIISPNQLDAQLSTLPAPTESTDYLVVNWQSNEGLPRDAITSIDQDKKGYVWLATPPYGLIRFDGLRFESFGQEVSSTLVQGEVRMVLSDRDSGLWLTTRREGLLRLLNRQVQRFPWDSSADMGPLDSVVQDKDGVVWVVTSKGKLGKVVGQKLFAVTDLPQASVWATMPYSLKVDALGQLWFHNQDTYGKIKEGAVSEATTLPGGLIHLAPSHDGGMWICNGQDLRHLPPGQTAAADIIAPLPAKYGTYIRTIYEDRAGKLWVGTIKHGLLMLVNGRLLQIPGVKNSIETLKEDREGNLWVGTQGSGLYKVSPRIFKQTGAQDGLSAVNTVSVGGDWIVPLIGNGPRRISVDGSLQKPEGLPEEVISVYPDANGGTWFGTKQVQLLYLPKNAPRNTVQVHIAAYRESRVLHCDQRGNLWIGGYPYGLSFLSVEKPRKSVAIEPLIFGTCAVTAIAESKDSNMWFGTSLGEIHRWDGQKFVTYGRNEGLSGSQIGSLTVASDGTLWVGTLGGGLGCLRDEKFKFASIAEGLPDDAIPQLIEDDLGWIWGGSSNGIFRLRRAELDAYMNGTCNELFAVKFGSADGLENIHCTAGYQPSVWKTPEGVLRFATSAGVVSVNPARLSTNPPPPPLVLEQVKVDGVTMSNHTNLQLPHDYTRIQFNYAALNFSSPDNVRYRKHLYGYDEGWGEASSERTASYSRLPPGRYQFRFTARNNNGIWNETPIVQNFEVKAAFWQTGWFRFIALLALVGIVAAAVRYFDMVRMKRKLRRLEQAHALERERVRIARDLHDDLGARLTKMAFATDIAAMNLADPVATHAQLRDVSEQARQATRSLDETVWMVDPLQDSLPQLVGYCSQYANNFFNRTPIGCRQHICYSPPDYPLGGELRHHVFSAYKEALNNVLKHSAATEVVVRIQLHGNKLCILIRDNGTGFTPPLADSSRNGLKNMHSRLETVGGSCVLRSKLGRGTRVLLRFTLPTGAPESTELK